MRLSPSPRIKAYRAAAGLGPTSEMGSDSDLTALKCDFRYASASGLESDITACPKGAKERKRFALA
jgi:hypothetical protein